MICRNVSCGEEFESVKKSQLYCNGNCRTAALRYKQRQTVMSAVVDALHRLGSYLPFSALVKVCEHISFARLERWLKSVGYRWSGGTWTYNAAAA